MSGKTYTVEQVKTILLGVTQEEVLRIAQNLKKSWPRDEVAKAIIPSHKHNEAIQAGPGVEDIPPGKLDGKGINKADAPVKCKKCSGMHLPMEKCSTTKSELIPTPKKVNKKNGSGGIVLPGAKLKKAAAVPTAKPPSGTNPVATPASNPKPPKGLEKKGLSPEAMQHGIMVGSQKAIAPAPTTTPVKLPNPEEQAERATTFSAAQAGEFQPKGPVSSGLELAPVAKPQPKPVASTISSKPAKRPGIFGRLFG